MVAVILGVGLVLIVAGVGGARLLANKSTKNTPAAPYHSTQTAAPRPGSHVAAPPPDTPAVAALMARIRASKLCGIHNADALLKYAPAGGYARTERSLNRCTALVGTYEKNRPNTFKAGTDVYHFELTLGDSYDSRERETDTSEQVGTHQVFRSVHFDMDDPSAPQDTCAYHLPFPGSEFAVGLEVIKTVAKGPRGQIVNWPERCQVAKEYLGVIAAGALSLPARTGPPEDKLTGKDPCAQQQKLTGIIPGWTAGLVTYTDPYHCTIPFTKSGESYTQTLSVIWRIDTEPDTKTYNDSTVQEQAQRIQRSGLGGVQFRLASTSTDGSTGQPISAGGTCSDTMVVKRADPSGGTFDGVAINALIARVELVSDAPQGNPEKSTPAVPAPSCDPVDKATDSVIEGLGS